MNIVKRIISIVLMLIFLNYLLGYYVIFWVLKRQADSQMIQKLNTENYSDNETVTFKFPFTLPYYKDWNSYERIDGSFQYNGDFFKLVKQKLNHDTLYIVCIKDYNVKRISGLVTDFIKLANDLTANSKTIKLVGNFSKDYQPQKISYALVTPADENIRHHCLADFAEIKMYIAIPSPPPKA